MVGSLTTAETIVVLEHVAIRPSEGLVNVPVVKDPVIPIRREGSLIGVGDLVVQAHVDGIM